MPKPTYTTGIVHFDDVDIQGRRQADEWLRIYHEPATGKKGWWVKGAIAEMETTGTKAFMWRDFYRIKSYGATQPGPEKSEPGKKTGWVLIDVGNKGMEYFSWTKYRRMTTKKSLVLGNKKAVSHQLAKRTGIQSTRDFLRQLIYETITVKSIDSYFHVWTAVDCIRVCCIAVRFLIVNVCCIPVHVCCIVVHVKDATNMNRYFHVCCIVCCRTSQVAQLDDTLTTKMAKMGA